MKYDNSKVRRQDRLLEKENAIHLLQHGEYGILSMSDGTSGYGIPLNYVWDGEDSIYIHCAMEGHKLNIIAKYPDVSFCVVGNTKVLPDKFSTLYESIVVTGKAVLGLPEDERMKALEWILDKYSPEDKEVGMKYAAASFKRTEIIRIQIITFSGKNK